MAPGDKQSPLPVLDVELRTAVVRTNPGVVEWQKHKEKGDRKIVSGATATIPEGHSGVH